MDNWDRLNKLGKVSNKNPLEKKVNQLTRVISDPDVYNVNVASRERIERLEKRVSELENKLTAVLKRIDTLSDTHTEP
tara:strand:+ start:298 stop:531 length:234 start_codon:yes stop_codon:yes gene_type:complete